MCEHVDFLLNTAVVVSVWLSLGFMGTRVGRAWFALKGIRDLKTPITLIVIGPFNLIITVLLCVFDGKDERNL